MMLFFFLIVFLGSCISERKEKMDEKRKGVGGKIGKEEEEKERKKEQKKTRCWSFSFKQMTRWLCHARRWLCLIFRLFFYTTEFYLSLFFPFFSLFVRQNEERRFLDMFSTKKSGKKGKKETSFSGPL